MDPLMLERSRSASTSSHVSTISNQSNNSSNNNLNHYDSIISNNNKPIISTEVDNELAEAANALTALGILRNNSISSLHQSSQSQASTSNSSNSINQRNNRPTNPSRSASITSQGSWSQSGPSNSTGATSPTGYTGESEVGDYQSQVGGETSEEVLLDPKFMSRVSQLPLVSGGLEWYERSKASSRVVKYGAGLVESSFSAVSRPLANNLQLNSLDEFACRQLDRLGASSGSSPHPIDTDRRGSADGSILEDKLQSGVDSTIRGRQNFDSTTTNLKNREASYDRTGALIPLAVSSESSRMNSPARSVQDQTVVVASRSRWQSVLVEAGGIGAAVSVESLKSLRYCLQWLLYATAHLDHQITVLRDFIISLHRHYGASEQADILASASASAHLVQIKHDVVDTIRKVVEVVSKYAGAALPEQAKKYVRQSILGLPVKWASAVEGGNSSRSERRGSVGTASSAGTPRAERMEDPRMEKENGDSSIEHREYTEVEVVAAAAPTPLLNSVLRPTEDAAERVLTFAVESLDMLKSVTQIFGESVEKAEAWIERLRIVGLDRQRQRQAAQSTSTSSPPPPPTDSTVAGTKRRRGNNIPLRDDPTFSSSTITSSIDITSGAVVDGEESLVRRKKGARKGDVPGVAGMDC